jgi:hypothetical protein
MTGEYFAVDSPSGFRMVFSVDTSEKTGVLKMEYFGDQDDVCVPSLDVILYLTEYDRSSAITGRASFGIIIF